MACITEAAVGFPNASGTIPPENGMLPEILGERGWNTYMVGKWHLCPTIEMNVASTRRNWPSGRGFERFYGFLGAETNQWYPDLVYDNHPVDQPRSPEQGYHLTEDLTDKALEFIRDAKVIAPDKPFFLYYAPGAAHAPHHAPREWIEKFTGPVRPGLRGDAGADPGPAEEAGHRPGRHRAAAGQPDRHAARPAGPGRAAVPAAGRHPALGLAVGAGEGAVRPDGGGLRGLPGPRRPPHRPAAGLPGGVRAAREHPGDPGLRQRGERRGRPRRVGEREQVRERHPRRHPGQPRDARRAGRDEDLQPLSQRLGDGLQHPVQDVEALRVQRRHRGPVHHLLAAGHGRPGRAAAPVPPRHRHRADDPGRARGARPRRPSRATSRAASTA